MMEYHTTTINDLELHTGIYWIPQTPWWAKEAPEHSEQECLMHDASKADLGCKSEVEDDDPLCFFMGKWLVPRLRCHLDACIPYQSAWVPVSAPLPPPASCSRTPWEVAGEGQVLGSLPPTRESRTEFQIPGVSLNSPGCDGHLGVN